MSLFSGMKISGGKGEKSKDDSASRTGQEDSTEKPAVSAFGFIRDTPKSSSTAGDPTLASSSATIETRAPSQTQVDDPAPCPQTRSKRTTPGVNFDIDLDLDFELDPLRPGLKQDTGQVTQGTDLEGIDFSKDVDLDALLEECNINVKTDAPANKEDKFEDARAELERERDQKGRDNLDMEMSSSEPKGKEEKELNIDDEHKGHTAVSSESKFGFISDSDGDDNQIPTECSSRTIDDVSSISLRTKNPDDGASSLYDIELDVQDTLDVLLESHAASEHQLRLAEEALSEELESLGKERLKLMYSMIRKQKKLDELQTAQSQAINEENYEQAEILTTECNSLEEDLQCIPRVTLDDGVGDIFSSRTIIHEKRKRQRSEWILALQDLQNQQEDVISKMREGRSGDPEGQKLKLDTQKTELDRAMGHVLLDKNHVEKREAQLWARIDEKTADLRESRDKLAVQKGKVQDEIAALEEQLRRLRSEEERLSSEIGEQENAIDEVKAEFSEEISIIEEEESNVKEREDRLTKDKLMLDEDEKALTAEVLAFEEALAREEDLMSRISSSQDTISSLNPDQEEGDDDCKAEWSIDLEPSSDITGLREKVLSTTEEMQFTSTQIISNKARLATLKKKVTDTEDHIVTLQEAKQFAVSMRKFGEAKRLTEEIKSKMGEGQSHQAEVEAVSEELKKQQTTLNGQQEQVVKLKIELAKEEKKWELQLCERAKTTMAVITTRLEDKESMNSTLSARKLEIEKQACALLVGWLCGRHGLQMLPEVAAMLEEFKDHEGMGLGDDVEDGHQSKTPTNAMDDKSCEVQRELQELEENLQKAIEAEDFDAADILCIHV
ncbi:E3 ubiquitin-protein ligase BRE1 [Strongylocentrotus purpuratus]|uniref:Uncharacterized protein n=1 Tax=Strongylocentrotus purpuratus TaxID=7668 RepID=A0A7M7PQL6_STRPU|nr:E3 ubiquitin-protein ligase BRE1 [Strongylocentrotus purpuratus]